MHQIGPESDPIATDDDSLYPYVNNDIEYGLLEDIVDSYYLDSQIKDDFQCDHDCYSQYRDPTNDNHSNACTHDYHHITQSVRDLTDSTQQNTLQSMEENASSFTDDTDTHCDFSIADHILDTENTNDTHTCFAPKYPAIHSQRKHIYRRLCVDFRKVNELQQEVITAGKTKGQISIHPLLKIDEMYVKLKGDKVFRQLISEMVTTTLHWVRALELRPHL